MTDKLPFSVDFPLKNFSSICLLFKSFLASGPSAPLYNCTFASPNGAPCTLEIYTSAAKSSFFFQLILISPLSSMNRSSKGRWDVYIHFEQSTMCFGLEYSPRLQYKLSKVNYSPTPWGLVSHLSTYKSPRMPHVSPGWGRGGSGDKCIIITITKFSNMTGYHLS